MRVAVLLTLARLSMHAASLQGVVLDQEGHPVRSATVRLQDGPTTTTGAKGDYRFEDLHAGTFSLRVEMSGSNAASGPFTLTEKEVKHIDLTLQPAFFDEPKFIVAGVTASTYQGGHGSDAILRSTESLAKATVSLSPGVSAPPDAATLRALRDSVVREPADADLHHRLAAAEEFLGHNLEAVHEYQRAAELDPSESHLFDWGAELLKHRADAPAIEVFAKSSRLYPDSLRTLLGLGTAYYALGSYEQAARYFFQACDVDPKNADPYLFLGRVHTTVITQSDGFLLRMERFAKLYPGDAQANFLYGASLWTHRDGAAVKLLGKAVELDPHLAAAHSLLGIVYAESGDLPRAIAAFQKAISIDPALEEAHYRLAQIYRRTGDAAKAQSELAAYQTLSKNSTEQVERERSHLLQFVFDLRQ